MHTQCNCTSPPTACPFICRLPTRLNIWSAAGVAPGREIPPIRTGIDQDYVNPNTVARAYLELERAGVVVKRHGSGTYVPTIWFPARAEGAAGPSQRVDALYSARSRHCQSAEDFSSLSRIATNPCDRRKINECIRPRSIIETSGLSRKLGQKLALNQVSLKIPRRAARLRKKLRRGQNDG